MAISSTNLGEAKAPLNPTLDELVKLAKGEGSNREEFLSGLQHMVNDPHKIIKPKQYDQLNKLCVAINKNGFSHADLFIAAAWLNSCDAQRRLGGSRGL